MKKESINIHYFSSQVQKLPYDPVLSSYKEQLVCKGNPTDISIFPNQFFYISDMHRIENHYIHPNTEKILGYSPENFRRFGFIYDIIHTDDREFVLAFSMKTIAFSRELKEELKKDPFCTVFSIDFRVCRSDGREVRLNRQTSCYRIDREGNMAYALSLFTDISHLKKPECITYSWAGAGAEFFSIDDILELQPKPAFSNREVEVLQLLAKGLEAKSIAERLYISEHTVVSHRKNMLHKTETKNTTELVRYAMNKGLI